MSFIDLVNTAFFSKGQDRAVAEAQLIEQQTKDPQSFFVNSALLLSDETKKSDIRQAASTLIKLSVATVLPNDPQSRPLWYHVEAPKRQEIKEKLIQLLIHNDVVVRKSSAVVIKTKSIRKINRTRSLPFSSPRAAQSLI